MQPHDSRALTLLEEGQTGLKPNQGGFDFTSLNGRSNFSISLQLGRPTRMLNFKWQPTHVALRILLKKKKDDLVWWVPNMQGVDEITSFLCCDPLWTLDSSERGGH